MHPSSCIAVFEERVKMLKHIGTRTAPWRSG